MRDVITFDHFEPGAVIGETVETFDAALAERWQHIFGQRAEDGAGGAAETASLALVMMMRAYLNIVTPRPPGNVHARQRFVLQNMPHAGEAIRTVVTCIGKELKRERRYVELQASGSGNLARPLYTGRMTLIWAA